MFKSKLDLWESPRGENVGLGSSLDLDLSATELVSCLF